MCPQKNARGLKKITYLNEGRGSPRSVAAVAAERCAGHVDADTCCLYHTVQRGDGGGGGLVGCRVGLCCLLLGSSFPCLFVCELVH